MADRSVMPPWPGARMRSDAGLVLVVVLVVAVTTATAAGVGRSLDRLTRASVAEAIAAAEGSAVGITATTLVDRELARPDGVTELGRAGVDVRADLPPPLPQVVGEPMLVVDTVRFVLSSLPGEPPLPLASLLTFRAQDAGFGLEVREGREPTTTDETVQVTGTGVAGDELPVHEVALSQASLERLGLEVGDRLLARPDLTDPLARRAGLVAATPIVVEVVGELLLSSAESPVWWGDPRLHRPAQIDTGTTTTFFAFGWVPPEVDGVLPGAGTLPAQVEWRHPVRTSVVGEVGAAATLAAARALSAGNEGLVPGFGTVVASSRLDRVLADEEAERGAAVNVLALGMSSVGGVGVAVLLLLALLLGERRRERTALTMGRGASRGQLLTGTLTEAVALAVAGGAVGVAAALLVLPGAVTTRDIALVGTVVLASALALVVGGARGQGRPLRDLLQPDRRPRGRSIRSRAVEGAVLVVAVAGVVALRRRGVDSTEPDGLVVVVPVLLGFAAGLLVRRTYRLPLRAGAAAARRRRGLGTALGLSRGARLDVAGPMVVVVVVATAVAIFAGALANTIEGGQDVASWEQVGAPVRVDADPGVALDPLDVEATVVEGHRTVLAANSGGDAFGRADVLAVDLQAMEDVLGDSAAPLDLPSRALADVPVLDGGATPVIPLVASVRWFNNQVLRLNDQVDVLVGNRTLAYQVVGFRRRLLGLDEDVDGPFLVVPRAPTEAVLGAPLPTTTQFVDTDDVAAVRGMVGDGATVVAREQVRERLARRSLPQGVVVGYVAVSVAALGFAVLAILVQQVLTARRRVRDLAVLAAVGTPRRTRFAVSLLESLPAVLIGVLAGSFVGRVTGDLLDGVVDLSPFTGTPTVDVVAGGAVSRWGTLAIVLAVTVLVAGLTWRGDRVDAARTLRED